MDKNIKKIIPFVKPYKKHIFWNIFNNILYALFSTLSFIALMPMMQVLFETTKTVIKKPVWTDIWDITKYGKELLYYNISLLDKQNALVLVIILIISTFFFKNMFNYFASYHMMHLQNNVLKDMRIKLFEKIISLPIGFYSEQRKGDVMSRMLGDVGQFQNTFFVVLELIVREPLIILFTIIAMFNISVKLTLFVFVFIPISGFIISRLGKNLKSKSNKAQAESGFFISILEETLGGMKVVKSYNAENTFTKKFTDSIMRMIKLSTSIGNKNNLASPLSEFLGIVTIAILLWYGGKMVLVDHTLEGAVFIVYMALAYNILTPAKAISKASYSVKAGMAAAERVLVILEHENPITSKENAIEKNTFEDKIEIKNINFRYEEENVLKNFTITVPKGKTIALVGQSGSGKSTIANLLTRFYDVNEGNITIDGIDIKDMKLESLRGLMGLVTQDSILFNDTIKNNILLGKENATDEEVIEALKIANAYEFVMNLPNGIETNIGDAGNKLSGGQKQRLSIARAVLKNPPIMILDEATSALDTESEKFVQIALENMMQNRTSIVIAHRLSTIQKADNIIVMKKGEIVEQGTHTELLALNGTYSNLVTMQSFE
ncbi:ABC transporter ATP-binding protein [Flavobacterium psychrophilum]|uniref:ABC transporter ATP-binding protein n=1 Tax=Flavobacterium psychrophilum TaxID=96345 RepID=UPI000B7C51C3|nr:ABC transporter ATP-binding protein [Flavobacterium psychrophilum]EKT4520188.1 ABC transporter ATP-binding protein [Flavobacterium psychrophilum]SNB30878.1 Lipid A export ATP-binding/permease protein MsbA [Flavobacterium psychrophilum]